MFSVHVASNARKVKNANSGITDPLVETVAQCLSSELSATCKEDLIILGQLLEAVQLAIHVER